jgi:hypothetical protein
MQQPPLCKSLLLWILSLHEALASEHASFTQWGGDQAVRIAVCAFDSRLARLAVVVEVLPPTVSMAGDNVSVWLEGVKARVEDMAT